MSGVSVGTGLVSGTDYTTMITQLMAIEAQPQDLLKNQLATAQSQASALRQVNTSMAALASAAKAVTAATAWTAAKAASSSSAVTATAGTGAATGSLTCSVDQLASAHAVVSGQNWTSTSQAAGFASPLTVTWADNTTKDIPLDDADGNGTVSLGEAVTSINKAGVGITAAAVSTGSGYRLQVTSASTGAAKSFSLGSTGMAAGYFGVLTQGQNAKITSGGPSPNAYSVTSSSN